MKYRAILADPPWHFTTFSSKGQRRSAARHYDTMGFDRIADIPVSEWADDNAVLFMWATDPMLAKALKLMGEWGFTYKTVAFYWTKRNRDGSPFVGMGYWTRANPEPCLLGTKGCPTRRGRDVRRWIDAPRREHSRKPDCIYERIERLVEGPYLEMFARSTREGWDAWGNEVGKFGEVA